MLRNISKYDLYDNEENKIITNLSKIFYISLDSTNYKIKHKAENLLFMEALEKHSHADSLGNYIDYNSPYISGFMILDETENDQYSNFITLLSGEYDLTLIFDYYNNIQLKINNNLNNDPNYYNNIFGSTKWKYLDIELFKLLKSSMNNIIRIILTFRIFPYFHHVMKLLYYKDKNINTLIDIDYDLIDETLATFFNITNPHLYATNIINFYNKDDNLLNYYFKLIENESKNLPTLIEIQNRLRAFKYQFLINNDYSQILKDHEFIFNINGANLNITIDQLLKKNNSIILNTSMLNYHNPHQEIIDTYYNYLFNWYTIIDPNFLSSIDLQKILIILFHTNTNYHNDNNSGLIKSSKYNVLKNEEELNICLSRELLITYDNTISDYIKFFYMSLIYIENSNDQIIKHYNYLYTPKYRKYTFINVIYNIFLENSYIPILKKILRLIRLHFVLHNPKSFSDFILSETHKFLNFDKITQIDLQNIDDDITYDKVVEYIMKLKDVQKTTKNFNKTEFTFYSNINRGGFMDSEKVEPKESSNLSDIIERSTFSTFLPIYDQKGRIMNSKDIKYKNVEFVEPKIDIDKYIEDKKYKPNYLLSLLNIIDIVLLESYTNFNIDPDILDLDDLDDKVKQEYPRLIVGPRSKLINKFLELFTIFNTNSNNYQYKIKSIEEQFSRIVNLLNIIPANFHNSIYTLMFSRPDIKLHFDNNTTEINKIIESDLIPAKYTLYIHTDSLES